jgi:hypothetical protein
MGILHKGDSKSKVKVTPTINNSITENLNNNNNNPNSNLPANSNNNTQANKIINNIKTITTNKIEENINEASNNIKTQNSKPHNINSIHSNKNNAIPVKIERKDLTPLKQINNLYNNPKPISAKDKNRETKNSSLYNNDNNNSNNKNNESQKKLKEIENNLTNLNNFGKNYQNINSQIEKINNIGSKLHVGNKENNKNSVYTTKEKNEINIFNKPSALAVNKGKNAGLNINYGVFEETKFEEPKFNVFYEKHESPYKSNLNDNDYINVNKNPKENRLLSAHRYENINDPSNNSNKIRPNENINQPNNKLKNNLEDKGNISYILINLKFIILFL